MKNIQSVRLGLFVATILLTTSCGQNMPVISVQSTIPNNSFALPSQTGLIMPSSLIVPTMIQNTPVQTMTSQPRVSSTTTDVSSIVVNNSVQQPTSIPVSKSMIGAKQYSQTVLPFTFLYPPDWVFHHELDGSVTFLSPKSADTCHNDDPSEDRVHYECVPDMSLRSYASEKDYLGNWGPSPNIKTLTDLLRESTEIRLIDTHKVAGNMIVSFFAHNSEADTIETVIETNQMVYQLSFDRDGISHSSPHVLSEQQKAILGSIHFISDTTSNSNMQLYSASSMPFSFKYPNEWQVEDNGMTPNSICLASSATLAKRKKPLPSQPIEADSLLRQSDICISFIHDTPSQIGPWFDYSKKESLARLLNVEEADIEMLGTTTIDEKTVTKVLISGMPSHQIWYVGKGRGLYIIEFRQIIGDEPLTADELGIVHSLKLLNS